MNKIAISDISEPSEKLRFMWKKEWVRPHESLWSVMRNFRNVNGHCSYSGALKLLGIQMLGTPKKSPVAEDKYGIFSRYTIKDEWGDILKEQLLPRWYEEKMEPFSRLMFHAPELVSSKLYYCPKCMEYGYHSYIHQLTGIRTCPFHKGVRLKWDYSETYVFGESRQFEYDRFDEYTYDQIVFNVFHGNICDFDDGIFGRLPTEWHTPHDMFNAISRASIFSEYEEITVAASDIKFVNTDIKGGALFLEDNKPVPFVTIYDTETSDRLTYKMIEGKLREMNLKNFYIEEMTAETIKYLQYAERLLLLILAKDFMSGIHIDDIRDAEGNLITGGKISSKDDIGMKTLFLWEYTHSKLLHVFLNTGDCDELTENKAKYPSKRFCADSILDSGILYHYGLSTMLHILKDHMKSCFREFVRFLIRDREYRKNGLGLNDEYDLLGTPTYVVMKNNNVNNIYRS